VHRQRNPTISGARATAARASRCAGLHGSVAEAFDDAPAEMFFTALESELVYRRSWLAA
jgi:hypothetical protein